MKDNASSNFITSDETWVITLQTLHDEHGDTSSPQQYPQKQDNDHHVLQEDVTEQSWSLLQSCNNA